jgi:hypothetical protein
VTASDPPKSPTSTATAWLTTPATVPTASSNLAVSASASATRS